MSIYVDGTNLTYTTAVLFGGVAGQITTVTDTRVTVLTPASAISGAVDVTVQAQGASDVTSSGAYTYVASAPATPSGASATAGFLEASVSWTAPSSGGQPIIDYTVTSSPGSFTCTTSCIVTGLSGGTSYTFTVTARNSVGSSSASAASNSVTVLYQRAPDAPTGASATAGIESATVTWTASVSDGGSPLTGYTAWSNPDARTCSTTSATTCTVTGLTPGTSYTFTVYATNAIGPSAGSTPTNSITALSPTAPGAPTSVTASPGIASATVNWTAPASNGGSAILDYTVTSDPGSLTCTTASTSCQVTGLSASTSYTFTVTARNAIGTGSASAASNTMIPDHPTLTSVSPNSGTANGGNSVVITGTNLANATAVTFDGVAATITANTSTTITVTMPPHATVGAVPISVTVAGPATVSAGSAYTYLAAVPNPPTAVSATAGIEKATVSWTAPALTGGQPVTGYTVTSSPGNQTCTTTGATSCVVNDLDSATSYTFTVTAANATGSSAASSASSAITPLAPTAPDAPTGVSATAGVRQAVVSWTAPASTGGRSITGYTVTSSPGGFLCTATSSTTCTVTGLTNLGTYTFTVTATNEIGTSAASSASTAITLVEPTISNGGISPSMGTALGGTTVTITGTNLAGPISVTFGGNAGTIVSSTSTTIVVTTPPSTSSNTVDVVVTVPGDGIAAAVGGFAYLQSGPSAPRSVAASLNGAGSAVVTWTAPALPGSSAIVDFVVTSSPTGLTCTTASTTCTMSDLLANTAYTFTVIARNIDGPSVASAASNAVTRSSGGGGGGGGGAGGSSEPTATPTQAPQTNAPAATGLTGPAAVTPPALAPAVIRGYTPPAQIKVPGRTILVPRTLRTTDGQIVRAVARVKALTPRGARKTTTSVGARIVRTPSTRITVVTTGERPVTVTLRLTAPATATSAALDETFTWRVRAIR